MADESMTNLSLPVDQIRFLYTEISADSASVSRSVHSLQNNGHSREHLFCSVDEHVITVTCNFLLEYVTLRSGGFFGCELSAARCWRCCEFWLCLVSPAW